MDERNGNDYVPFNTSIAVRRGWLVYFEQSCNGLVLCTVHDGHGSGYYYTTRVIYNPSMRHCKTLPSPPFRKATDRVSLKDVYYIEIYSSKTNSWRNAGDPFPFSSQDTLSESGVYWNGSVHWINQWSATLHYFDIGCELVKTIAMPTKPHLKGHYYDKRIVYFNEYKGHIHLMQMCEDDMPYIDIWEMRRTIRDGN
ncbi:F-box protein At5g07610-like [Papaver somniferum]|uniref:F-box protein At5g07610-like n=1 Tax=Papaver somniferum TaxID=3469 RepID=UPI000E6FADC8|nr:F-box protein At5g07610-like [Papaver somniferum]